MQCSTSSGHLLKRLQAAIDTGHVDSSVFGAAAQRCGQGRWWDALQEVLNLQRSIGVPFLPLDRNMYLTALFRCVRGEKGFGVVRLRQREVVTRAKEVWMAIDQEDERFANSGLNAALRLCAVAGKPEGWAWAQELWSSAVSKHKDTISYGSYALVLETCDFPAKVDYLLAEGKSSGSWKPTHVDLGALVNAAGEQFKWQRAEVLWHVLINQHGVVPNLIAYVARAKAHLLSGRVNACANVLDEMLTLGHALNPHAAQTQIQSLLIVYHASLSHTAWRRLEASLRKGQQVVKSEGSTEQKQFLKQVDAILVRLRKTPERVRLNDVLLEWKAQNSRMASWKAYAAGSNYL